MTNELSENVNTSSKIKILKENVPDEGLTLDKFLNSILDENISLTVMILSAPFLIPVSIPGSSTPFGILIILLEISQFIGKIKLPKRIGDYFLEKSSIISIFDVLEKFMGYLEHIIKPRGFLVNQKGISYINSLMIIVLAVLLLLPLPIPLTDFVPAISILVLTLATLEKDSYTMILGYVLFGVAVAYFYSVGYIGVEILIQIVKTYIL